MIHVVKAWCENTSEGKSYLKFNGYRPLFRLGRIWITTRIGQPLRDVSVIF